MHTLIRFLVRIDRAGQFLCDPPLAVASGTKIFLNYSKCLCLTPNSVLFFHKGYLEPCFPKILKRPLHRFSLWKPAKFCRLRNTFVASGTLLHNWVVFGFMILQTGHSQYFGPKKNYSIAKLK